MNAESETYWRRHNSVVWGADRGVRDAAPEKHEIP